MAAPLSLVGAGVSGIVAQSFARIFFRNALDLGLPVVVCPAADWIDDGEAVRSTSMQAPFATTRPTKPTTPRRSPSSCSPWSTKAG